ncbi:uncharacterized protein NESG_00891 [Nematocida ausubeli]|uniref:Rab-GAP TBC domain-containing protein n=1 Tax=Nematocida ausubeli (strain ATCC PRA-371 / ERTm2) TaxID=1913371 RepID=A0A086J3L9_NEMA1|nr:uncharacterized protein NESG_00891 [Nematocida ausubeli]KFG26737.1 hypothetical protein NESG_00891 [Nematocida ausubeli]
MWIEVYAQGKFIIEKKIEEALVETKSQKTAGHRKDKNSAESDITIQGHKRREPANYESEESEEINYKTVREYIIDRKIGRYRLVDKSISGAERVICGSWSFNRLAKWIEEGAPDFFQSLSFGMCIGSYIKAYESSRTVVLLGTRSIGIFGIGEHIVIKYEAVREIKKGNHMEISYIESVGGADSADHEQVACYRDGPEQMYASNLVSEKHCALADEQTIPETAGSADEDIKNGAEELSTESKKKESGFLYKKVCLCLFPELDEEIMQLALSPREEIQTYADLLRQRICERLCSTIPLYNQRINCIAMHSTGTVSITNNFLIIKEDQKCLAIPLCMIRKAEITKGWNIVLRVTDANHREFEMYLVDNEELSIDSILLNIAKEDPRFKSAYFSILLDILQNSKIMNCDLDSTSGNWSMGRCSEYRIYMCMKTNSAMSISVQRQERPFIWFGCFCLCGIVNDPGLFEMSVEKSKTTYFTSYDQIDKDIQRSIYEDVPGEVYAGLKRVMYAFTAYNNNEYLQSHAMVGGILYRILGESGCFYSLVHIFTRILPDYTGPEIYGMHRDVAVFIEFAKEKCPGLCDNLVSKEIELKILVTPWILSLFSTFFQRKHIEVIFDYLAYYGAVFLFKLSLALLERMYLGISRSNQTGSMLKISAEYFFNNTSLPSISDEEFSLLIEIAKSDKIVTPANVLYKRQQYELAHRKN